MDGLTRARKKYYASVANAYGNKPEANDWDRNAQMMRWDEQLLMVTHGEYEKLNNMSILDFGCGTGDFYQFLKEKGIQAQYTGMDVVPESIAIAKEKSPEASFEVCDIMADEIDKIWDYAFMSGIFNFRSNFSSEQILHTMQEVLRKVYSHVRVGICFNFISDYVNFTESQMAYYNPMKVMKYCIENLSRRVEMAHHYNKCDVCVWVSKNTLI